MTAVLPFKAAKRFTLDGMHVVPGDIVDVSMLNPARVANMEKGNFGLRVGADQAHEVRVPEVRAPVSDPTARASDTGADSIEEVSDLIEVGEELEPVAVIEDDVPAADAKAPRASTRKR